MALRALADQEGIEIAGSGVLLVIAGGELAEGLLDPGAHGIAIGGIHEAKITVSEAIRPPKGQGPDDALAAPGAAP